MLVERERGKTRRGGQLGPSRRAKESLAPRSHCQVAEKVRAENSEPQRQVAATALSGMLTEHGTVQKRGCCSVPPRAAAPTVSWDSHAQILGLLTYLFCSSLGISESTWYVPMLCLPAS